MGADYEPLFDCATARHFIERVGAEKGLPYRIVGDCIRAGLTKAEISDMSREEMITRFSRSAADRKATAAVKYPPIRG